MSCVDSLKLTVEQMWFLYVMNSSDLRRDVNTVIVPYTVYIQNSWTIQHTVKAFRNWPEEIGRVPIAKTEILLSPHPMTR